MTYDTLQTFRAEAYQHLSRAHDATFELLDAVMTTRHVYRTLLANSGSVEESVS
jgi:hypothetical protein